MPDCVPGVQFADFQQDVQLATSDSWRLSQWSADIANASQRHGFTLNKTTPLNQQGITNAYLHNDAHLSLVLLRSRLLWLVLCMLSLAGALVVRKQRRSSLRLG